MKFSDLVNITSGTVVRSADNPSVEHIITDSRKSYFPPNSLFIAIVGERHDAHQFIPELIKKGITQFVVERDVDLNENVNISAIRVNNSLQALQQIASHHRSEYSLQVVGITGSNGKTIIKEWLFQMLSPHYSIVKSPNSYNSQVGVPLSVWQIHDNHNLGIFEAGISKCNEMANLEKIIQPSLGIFTNIGTAHAEGFKSIEEKVREKLILFNNCETLIYCKDHQYIDEAVKQKCYIWGTHKDSDIRINQLNKEPDFTLIELFAKGRQISLKVPFTDNASVENAMHCITLMLFFNFTPDVIQEGLSKLRGIKMRLELKKGINQSYLIDDTYNNDLGGLQIALDYMGNHHLYKTKTLILSDLLQTGLSEVELYKKVASMISASKVDKLIAIGPSLSKNRTAFDPLSTSFYQSPDEFLKHFDFDLIRNELVLIKGARPFSFERIVRRMEEKIHGTRLEINLDALTHNLNFYRSKLSPGVKLMVMVKAFAYGSGSLEIANLLQYHRVDYLGVAYADEGVTLRKNGISLPIMVMNPTSESFNNIVEHKLEPEVYNLSILKELIEFLSGQSLSIHLKMNTGMNRLGFNGYDVAELIEVLRSNPNVSVKSIFSHMAGSDDVEHQDYSHQQASMFDQLSRQIIGPLQIDPLRHILNSPGIIRYPEYQYDMVRLGIGLYGVEANNLEQDRLLPISSLKTIISQVNHIRKGETVGYGRKGKADKDMIIATIAIGYADGYGRLFSNGVGEVWVKGKKCKVFGNVCMDMTMVDVTGLDVEEGDDVEIFGPNLTIQEMAKNAQTIPYEILTNVSQRVKRVYYSE